MNKWLFLAALIAVASAVLSLTTLTAAQADRPVPSYQVDTRSIDATGKVMMEESYAYLPNGDEASGFVYLGAAKPWTERLIKDHAKDANSLKAMMVLVQMHTQRNRPDKALEVKKRCVETFPDSAAALKYKADIAQYDCLGKPFFLRFKSAQGETIKVGDYKGKCVLVYFTTSLADPELAGGEAKTLKGLSELAGRVGGVLLAVTADKDEDTDKVLAILKLKDLATPVLLDPDGQAASQYGVLIMPAVAMVGPDGNLKEILADSDIVPAVRRALVTAASQPTTQPAKP